jgi:hypothetical protein
MGPEAPPEGAAVDRRARVFGVWARRRLLPDFEGR